MAVHLTSVTNTSMFHVLCAAFVVLNVDDVVIHKEEGSNHIDRCLS